MNLSEHFTLQEFISSQTATRRGLSNAPDDDHVFNLIELCLHILEPVRKQFGPVIISSGYRSKALNSAIGGSNTSQHSVGEAADIICPRVSPRDVCEWITEVNLPFWQLIYEGTWAHVSYKHGQTPRFDVKTAIFKNGQPTRYVPGLEA